MQRLTGDDFTDTIAKLADHRHIANGHPHTNCHGKASADLVSLSEKIDTTSAAGKMMFRMLAVLAEFERDQISERTTTAMRFKASQGQRVGKVPFGHDLGADGIALVANPVEQQAIAIINELRASGVSLRKIAVELTDRGIPTKAVREWTPSTIQRIVNRTAA